MLSNTRDTTLLKEQILNLKREKNAIILAHYYQESQIQDVADYVGDSLGLSQKAASTDARLIVFAGVHFMAETAKILNPTKKVLLPDSQAGCSLAASCPPAEFEVFVKKHPGHVVVSYINCSAEVKALSDIICTSANGLEIINSIPKDRGIVFAPDINFGKYLKSKTGRDLVLWNGACDVHEAFSLEKIEQLQDLHPFSKLVVHPESKESLLKKADFVGSTSAMIHFIKKADCKKFIVATEVGILHQLQKEATNKILIPAPVNDNNACACSECRYMKMNTLEKLYLCLKDESPEVTIPEFIRRKALQPILRMLEVSQVRNQLTAN